MLSRWWMWRVVSKDVLLPGITGQFFHEVCVFCSCSMHTCSDWCYREIKTRGFEGQSKLLFLRLLIYFWCRILAGFFRSTSFDLRWKGESTRLSYVWLEGQDLTWHSFHCLLQLPVVKHTSISKAISSQDSLPFLILQLQSFLQTGGNDSYLLCKVKRFTSQSLMSVVLVWGSAL